MPDVTSTAKFKADISELKAAMQQASRAVKVANSEFKAATAGMDDWSKSEEGLQAKLKQLSTTLDAQKKKVALANEEYEKTVKLYGENSAEADRAKIALNNYIAAVNKTENEMQGYEKELKDCQNGTGDFADELDNLDAATLNTTDGFTVMKGALASLVADGVRMAISAFKDLAKETLEVGMNFESAMAKVGAVSGANAEDIERLTEKAKEMGETTIFSATESAEAFNYMAMAGWKTEDMLNGIEGIMNLAAASGSDLATTSDIVTDALTAMGYGAEDAGRLADVMAAASSNANTNVEMMGQTFQYAAPIIGALGMNMEDAAVAIGMMANAGIKGEKSGTALRSILTRLSAPPKECADAMDELGISLTDSDGKMKSLEDVMKDLRSSFADLSETEQTAYAKSIAGQEAMSGLLAIVNASEADFNKLTIAVDNSTGAAAQMAEVMNDNVQGSLTLLKSNIEGKMIKVYESASDSIKTAIGEISKTLDNVNWDKVGETVGKAAKGLVETFINIIKHGKDIITVVQAIGTVLVSVFVAKKLLTFASAVIGMVETFKSLKLATEGATAAQLLLNAAEQASPIGIMVAAVAGLTAGLLMLAANSSSAKEATNSLTEAERAQIEQVNALGQAYRDTMAARDESVKGIESTYGYYDGLYERLYEITGGQGKVKEGYEEEAQVIINTLNEALGLEIEMNDGVIQKYEQVMDTIDKVIEKKKAEAVLSANLTAYTEALENLDQAEVNYAKTLNQLTETQQRRNDAQAELSRLQGMSATEYANEIGLAGDLQQAQFALNQAKKEAQEVYNEEARAVYETKQAYNEAQDTYMGYMREIENYNGLQSALIEGDSQKISAALEKLSKDFKTAENSDTKSLEAQAKAYKDNYNQMLRAVEVNGAKISEKDLENAKKLAEQAEAEYKKAGEMAGEGLTQGIKSKEGDASSAGASIGAKSVNGLQSELQEHSPSRVTTVSGENFAQGFINGMSNKEGAVWAKATQIARLAIQALKQGQQEGSPSKLTYQSGIYFVQGYINGIVSQTGSLNRTVKSMVTGVVDQLRQMSNYNFTEVGEKASSNFSDALSSKFEYTLKRMEYENNKKVSDFDTAIEKLSTSKDAELKSIAAAQDSQIAALEAARDAQAERLEAERDAAEKEINANLEWWTKIYNNISEAEDDAGKAYYKNVIKQMEDEAKATIQAQKDYTKQVTEESNAAYARLIDETNAKYDSMSAQSEKYYDGLIADQEKYKDAYQTASSEMISEFSAAVSEYQRQAQSLIDSTIGSITSKYDDKYNELLNKQENLVSKLKKSGELFNVSGAGVITLGDINEQTRQINEYSAKLNKIRSKVSEDLFDEIASYDMKEGSAFIDQLLALSDANLKAYSAAYDKKMALSESIGEKTYAKDFKNLAQEYNKELNSAFKSLPAELEALGMDAMKGFLQGLTTNTDYMDREVRIFVQSMVDSFKTQLKIHSPSKVMESIGEYTGEGFIEGLKDTISGVVDTTKQIAQNAVVPLDDIRANIAPIRANVNNQGAGGVNAGNVVNNYNLVQNNTSPKALTALETYQARRQQIAMLKAATA